MNFLRRLFGAARAPEPDDGAEALGSPGWDFIESVLAELHPGQAPRHAAPLIAPQHDLREGRSPVEGTHVYDAGHSWHFVTLGLSDLHEDTDPSSDVSGWGYELCMRVAKRGESEPPLWPVALLNTIARHTAEGAVVGPGTSFRTGRVERAPDDARLEGVIALLDPELGQRVGPFGAVYFVLLVGLSSAELDGIAQGGGAALAEQLANDPVRWVT
jgi:suppressor of fused-like protein